MPFRILFLFLLGFSCTAIQAQCLSGNCTDGFGKFKYKNDNIYEGNFKGGYCNGKGKMFYSNGEYYEGDWVNGSWNGKGLYTWKDGRRFEGQVKDGYFVYLEGWTTL